MKIRYILTLFLTLLFHLTYSQTKFREYSENQKQIIFSDNFNNNNNNWIFDDNKINTPKKKKSKTLIELDTSYIGDGMMYVKGKALTKIKIDDKRDFEINTNILFRSKTDFCMLNYGAFIGKNDLFGGTLNITFSGNFITYSFMYQYPNGMTNIIQGSSLKIFNDKDKDYIEKNFYNVIMRKIKDSVYFYLNKEPILNFKYTPFFGQMFGFYGSNFYVEYYNASYLSDKIFIETKKYNQDSSGISSINQFSNTNNENQIKIDVDINIPINTINNNKTFAVIIGNENYKKEIKVKYALNDAFIFKQYLQKTLCIDSSNLNYTVNATYGQILDALTWINEVAKVYNGQAKIIFYYAGHGMPDEKTKSTYLLPVDGNSQNPATAIKLTDVYAKLTEFPSISVTVFLDACFSGSTRETNGTMLAQGRGVKIKPKIDLLSGNLVVFSAASGDETAFPYTEKQHGMFTYFLLKKLQESKGNATLNELSNYIITNVTQQSVVVNKKSQTPQVNTSPQIQNTWQTIKLK